MPMCGSDKSFYGGGDLDVGKTGADRKEEELLCFHMYLPTYHSCAKRRRCIKHSCSPISPIVVSLLPKREEEDKDGVIRACNRK